MSEQGPALSPKLQELKAKYEADPGSRLFLQLAEEYRKAELHEEAIKVCRAGLEKHSGYTTARVTLARSLLALKRVPEAQTELEAVIAAVPDNLLANRYLGDIYHDLGRAQDALARYDIVLMLNPGDEDVSARVAALQAAKGPSAAPAAVPTRARDVFGPRRTASAPTAQASPPPSPPTPAPMGDDFSDFMDLKMDESVILNSDMVQAALSSASAKQAEAEHVASTPLAPARVEADEVDEDPFGTPAGADDFADFSSPTVMLNTADLARMAGIEPAPDVAAPPAPPPALDDEEWAGEQTSAPPPPIEDAGLDDFSEFAAPTVMLNLKDVIASGALGGQSKDETKSAEVAPTDRLPPSRTEAEARRPPDYGTHMIPIEEIERAARQAASMPAEEVPASAPAEPSFEESPLGFDEASPALGETEGDSPADPFADALDESEGEDAGEAASESLAGRTLGELYLQQGHLEKALEVFERYLLECPDDDEVRTRVSTIRARQGGMETPSQESVPAPVALTRPAPEDSPEARSKPPDAARLPESRLQKINKLSNWLASLKKS